MKSKQEIIEYMKNRRIIPNILHIFLSRFEYEEAKQYLKAEVTEELFLEHISKTEEDLHQFLNTLRNSISSLFISLTNDILLPEANVMTFVDKILFLKQFLWFLDMEKIGNLLSFETISTDQLQQVKNEIKEMDIDSIFNFVEYEKYLVDVEKILSLKYRLSHKRGNKITHEKLISYIPKGFTEKHSKKKGRYWIKNIKVKKGAPKEKFIIREVKDLEAEKKEIERKWAHKVHEDLEEAQRAAIPAKKSTPTNKE